MKNYEFTKEWGVGLCSLVAIFTRVFYDPSKRGALKCITNAQEIAISHGDNSWNFKQKRESRNLEKKQFCNSYQRLAASSCNAPLMGSG